MADHVLLAATLSKALRQRERATASGGASLLERAMGVTALERMRATLDSGSPGFPDAALKALGIDYEAAPAPWQLPVSGPLVVVANHPFGCADGLVLLSLLTRTRSDVRLLASDLLRRVPQLHDYCFFVDTLGSSSQTRGNAAALRAAIRFVRGGGALAVFPAGEVSAERHDDGHAVDRSWAPAIGRLVQCTGADVVPVHFAGTNSLLFHLAGRVHPMLRTALLPRELLKLRGRTIRCRIGEPIEHTTIARLDDPRRVISYLRLRTDALAGGEGDMSRTARGDERRPGLVRIAMAEPADALEQEVQALDHERVLAASGEFRVYVARAGEAPAVLREIGRLRETAFRAAGEGSGRSRDLDRFDGHYRHLFLWNARDREVVGAYRIGATDEILPVEGIDGLYTSTLFRYDERLMAQIDPALELGRAFVRQEYQRDYSPLLLLWRGIAAFVARQPRYRMLFGPVSISSDYQSLSRQILARFLHATSYHTTLGPLVTPRNPAPFLRHGRPSHPALGAVVSSLAEVGALLSEIEADRKGVPVLVRQYLKLDARLLGFNVDSQFGNALDGLMLVDLADVERSVLARYMGGPAADRYLACHGVRSEPPRIVA